MAACTDDIETSVSWVNRLEYFSVNASNRAPLTSTVLLQRTPPLMLLFYSQEAKWISNFFISRSIVDFENNETPETNFYIFYDIFTIFPPYIMFHSKTLLRCTLLHN